MITKNNFKSFFILSLMFVLSFANAQGLAGLNDATSLLEDVLTWIQGFVVVVACIYVIYIIIMVMVEKKDWMDFAKAVGWAIVAGGGASLVKWAVGYFA